MFFFAAAVDEHGILVVSQSDDGSTPAAAMPCAIFVWSW